MSQLPGPHYISTRAAPLYMSSGLITDGLSPPASGGVQALIMERGCTYEPWIKKLVYALVHPDERSFLQQLEQKPTDPHLMLIYADWLDERGRGQEAEDLRRKVQLGRPWDGD